MSMGYYLDLILPTNGPRLAVQLCAVPRTECEAVNELFRFDVDALSTSTNLDLSSLIGEELSLNLLQADGGVARYRLSKKGRYDPENENQRETIPRPALEKNT